MSKLIREALDHARKISRTVRQGFDDRLQPNGLPYDSRASGTFFNDAERTKAEKKIHNEDKPIYKSLKVILKTQIGIFIDKYIARNKVTHTELKAMIRTFNELFFAKMLRILSIICISHRDKFFDLTRAVDEKKEAAVALWDELSREYVYYKTHGVMNTDLHREFIKKLLTHPLIANEINFFLAYHFNNATAVVEILNKGETIEFQNTSFEMLPHSMRKQLKTDDVSQTAGVRTIIPGDLLESGLHIKSKFGSDSMNQGVHFQKKGSTKTLDNPPTPGNEVDKKLLMTDIRQTIPSRSKNSQNQQRNHDDSDLISFITDAEIAEHKRKVQFLKEKGTSNAHEKNSNSIPKFLLDDVMSKGFYNYSDNGTYRQGNSDIHDILF